MKLIQVTDMHLTQPGRTVYDLDTLARFRACLRDINENHADADLVVLTGDIADSGEAASYEVLRGELADLVPPYRLMLGNHDRRDRFLAVYPELASDTGHVQAVSDFPDGRLVFLDTLETDEVPGRLCAARLGWLDARLAEAAERPVYLFMHHPPVDLGLPVLDSVRLQDPDALHAVLARHGNVRHIFAGHVHRMSAGSWRGIPFSTVRATAHQFGMNFTPGRLSKTHASPFYALILIRHGDVVVHFHDYTYRLPEYD